MPISKDILINEYTKALRAKNASIFLGAGFSAEVFNELWKGLVKPYADKLDPIILEHCDNYPLIMQYYSDKFPKDNFRIEIANRFKSDVITKKHGIIAKLPIQHYWTTNYDTLIENALIKHNKPFDTLYNGDTFADLQNSREKIVFKCHGDCNHPESIIITKGDNDTFENKSFNFVSSILSELATNKILFIGYSFNDPDINYLINKINVNNLKHIPHHLILKRETEPQKEVLQDMWVKDLERHSIYTTYIDDYDEIEILLKDIELKYLSGKILISGSANVYDEYGTAEESKKLIHDIGFSIIDQFKDQHIEIINGNGYGVGQSLSEGVAEAVASNDLDFDDYFTPYHFSPTYYKKFEKEPSIEEQWANYRHKMIDKCGIVFFLFGNRLDDNGVIRNAPCVRKEFDIAILKNKYVFPIGTTGYMAKELAEEVLNNFEQYNGEFPDVKKILIELNKPHVPKKEIVEGIIRIIDCVVFRS